MDNQSGTRIQKVLSDNGIMSRRKAEEAISRGRITVNGHPCITGQKINPRKDIVAIDGERIVFAKRKKNIYIMLNKPRGYVTTTNDEHGRRCVMDLVKDAPMRVYPVGRLDLVSEGLLLMTNDGDFANAITHPSGHVTKTYRVTLHSAVTEDKLVALSTGVMVDGKMTLPAAVHVLTEEPGRIVLQITISEGRNRQIRKMCEALNLDVARLKRTSVGPLKLGMLKPGEWRELTPAELISIRNATTKATGLTPDSSAPRRQPDAGGKRPTGPRPDSNAPRRRAEAGGKRPAGPRPESSAPRRPK